MDIKEEIKDTLKETIKENIDGQVKDSVVGTATSAFFGQLKIYLYIGLAISALLCVVFLQFKYNIFGWGESSLKIDKTALVVEQTKKIQEFTSAQFYEETAIKKERVDSGMVYNSNCELVVLVHGTVRAGFNLSKLGSNDIVVKGDTVSLKLPKPEIFDVIVNPSNYEIFIEDGKWGHEEVTEAVARAKKQIEVDAINNNILGTATKSGKAKLTELYKSFGFNTINIKVEGEAK